MPTSVSMSEEEFSRSGVLLGHEELAIIITIILERRKRGARDLMLMNLPGGPGLSDALFGVKSGCM